MSTTPRYFLITYNRIIRNINTRRDETVERSVLVLEKDVDLEIECLLEKGAFNIIPELDENIDEQVEREFAEMYGQEMS